MSCPEIEDGLDSENNVPHSGRQNAGVNKARKLNNSRRPRIINEHIRSLLEPVNQR
jgi:hypothetical protein